MLVILSYDDAASEYYLRQFALPLISESFAAPVLPGVDDERIEVPDHVVIAYCALQANARSMQTLLAAFDRQD